MVEAAEDRLHPAWAAGLFDGEGSINLDQRDLLRLQLKMVDKPTVERFRAAVGIGTIYGPYANRTGEKDGYPRNDFYLWVATGADAAHAWTQMYPWLSDVRRDKLAELTEGL